jgi:soluble lytic murein transglycosylase-like protein/TolA-binding protein
VIKVGRRKWLVILIAVLVLGGLAGGIFYWPRLRANHEIAEGQDSSAPSKPLAPPDLEKLREPFAAGRAAVDKKDGAEAVKQLSSFDFGSRAVEEYRLYYLANGHQLTGNAAATRATLARLFHRDPQLVFADDAGMRLGDAYAAAGDIDRAADVYARLASRTQSPVVAARARWLALQSRLAQGDAAGALVNARNIVIKSPKAEQAPEAIAVMRAFSGLADGAPLPLTPAERLERGIALLRDGDAQAAYDELTTLEPSAPASIKLPLQLNRGLALNQLRRFEDSNKVLEPLTSGPYKYAVPALYTGSKNYRVLASSINPMVPKTIVEKKQVGTTKVRVGKGKKRKTVTKPKFANVKKTIQLVDLAKKAKRDEYERLASERLKDMLLLPLADPVRLEVLNTLVGIAEAKNQDAYERQLVAEVVKLDRLADPGLQHFWDKAWAAYARGDLNGAKELLRFIADTYHSPNVRRQAEYWYARTIERAGDKAGAQAAYQRLAGAPYLDLYALHSVNRGAKRQEGKVNPLTLPRPDWRDVAERNMPRELRLAYELTALTDMRDARLEIQKNMNAKNQPYADALMAEIYNAAGDRQQTYRSLKRAFPELATVEQDSAPAYFIRMYYPEKYEDAIRKYSARQGIDPYLVMGLILQESYFNPRARSAVGATGLMQLMPATGRELGGRLYRSFNVSRLENPETNIELGTMHLKMLVDLFGGKTQLAIASYNAGQGNVMKWRRAAPSKPMDEFLESIPFPETRNYVKRVTMLRASYERLNQQ